MFMKKKQVYTGTVVVLHFLIKKIHLFFLIGLQILRFLLKWSL